MLFYNSDKRYNQFSEYLKHSFGAKVYKVTLDAGFTCPNRDGSLSNDGCIFCDSSGSFSRLYSKKLDVKEQLQTGISKIKEKYHASKFMSYFQAYTNTYGNINDLKNIYDCAFCEDVVGMSIGTRPDCVDEKKLELINSYTDNHEVWIEYGMQSIHDKSLKYINRGHNFQCFEKALKMTKGTNIKICAHVILGLPTETKQDMLETAQTIAGIGIQGVKIHQLCVLKNTKLEKIYNEQGLNFMDEDEYVELVCDFLELLPPDMTIQRLAGNGLKSILIAPKWLPKKFSTLTKIDKELERRDSHQGSRFH